MIFVSTSPAAGPIRFMKFLNRCAANSVRRSVHRQVIERRFELRLFVFAQFQLVRVSLAAARAVSVQGNGFPQPLQ